MIERTIGFIGAGVMGGALLDGVIRAGMATPEIVCASDPSAERREGIAGIPRDQIFDSNRHLVQECGVVVLAVKPGIVPSVAAEIAGHLGSDHLVISVAAGVSTSSLSRMLGTDRIIRAMPNTPALVGCGASAFCGGAGATEEDLQVADDLLSAVGVCVRVEESMMDAVTGLSGSGPAYVYLAIEALSDGGVKMGLPRKVATLLASQTVMGAAKMVIETGRHPGELKDQVTTPGGTTIDAIHALELAGLRRAFIEAVTAATEKSRRLSKD